MNKTLTTFALLWGILTINVGESKIIQKIGWGTGEVQLQYCGMPSGTSFSIKSNAHRSSVNIYYPLATKESNFAGGKIKVLKVTPESLTVEVLDEI